MLFFALIRDLKLRPQVEVICIQSASSAALHTFWRSTRFVLEDMAIIETERENKGKMNGVREGDVWEETVTAFKAN